MSKSAITTHVLDTHLGKPAKGVPASLSRLDAPGWEVIAQGYTNDDGRITDWMGDTPREVGEYKVAFATGEYFADQELDCLYPEVVIYFTVREPDQHYHIPLLISANSYSTYRGS